MRGKRCHECIVLPLGEAVGQQRLDVTLVGGIDLWRRHCALRVKTVLGISNLESSQGMLRLPLCGDELDSGAGGGPRDESSNGRHAASAAHNKCSLKVYSYSYKTSPNII